MAPTHSRTSYTVTGEAPEHASTVAPRSSSSHHRRHRHPSTTAPGEKQTWFHRHTLPMRRLWGCTFILFTCLIALASATATPYIPEEMLEPQDIPSRLLLTGSILVDHRSAPVRERRSRETEHNDLQARADPSSIPPSSSSSSSSTSDGSSSTTASTSSSMALAAATGSASPLPTVFDSGFSANVTDSCASFISAFTNNSTFQSCLPFSLLLQNSNSFFQASKSLVRMTQTLDATCAAPLLSCNVLMTALASNLTSTANCGSDLSTFNPFVSTVHLGLEAYKVLYTASCLRDPSTSSYCFADAVTNASSPTDSYIYYLPLNISLPGGSQPTCDSCLKNTMAVFEAASADRSSSISSTYVNAATAIDLQCGPGFVNASLPTAVTSRGTANIYGTTAAGNIGLAALGIMAVGSLLRVL
ncbi:hypothetical protein B7494_g2609 [Chlorociboria aeruginascens]|nr:hypothetical protein B7494_g2609 [Chlorociboria aeruginascens]